MQATDQFENWDRPENTRHLYGLTPRYLESCAGLLKVSRMLVAAPTAREVAPIAQYAFN